MSIAGKKIRGRHANHTAAQHTNSHIPTFSFVLVRFAPAAPATYDRSLSRQKKELNCELHEGYNLRLSNASRGLAGMLIFEANSPSRIAFAAHGLGRINEKR
jgi:hypothetical protein